MSLILPWLMFALAGLFYAYEIVLRLMPSTMVPQLTEHFLISKAQLGMISSMFYLGYVTATAVSGTLYDYYGVKRILILACGMCVLGTFLFSMTDSFAIAQYARCVVGFGSAFAFIGVMKIGFDCLPQHLAGKLVGMVSFLAMIFAAASQNLLSYAVALSSWTQVTQLMSFSGLVMLIVMMFVLQDNPGKNAHPHNQQNINNLLLGTIKILRNRKFWVLGFIGMVSYIPLTGFAELWCIPYLQDAYHLSKTSASFDSSMVFLGWGLGAPYFGYLSDRFQNWQVPLLTGFSLATFCVSWVLFGSVSTALLPFVLFIFGFLSSSHILVFIGTKDLSVDNPHLTGTVLALTNLTIMMSGFLVQPSIGFMLDLQNSFTLALSLVPISMALGGIATLYMLSHSRANLN